MFNKFISIKAAALLLGVVLIAGIGYSANAQKHGNGNGHGNGGDKHGGEGNRGGGEDRERGNHGNGGRGERQQYEQRQNPQAVYSNPDRGDRGDRGERGNKHGNGNGNQNRGNDGRSYQVYQPQVVYGGGWVPPGQIRSREVHERNDARKEWKDQRKENKRWEKNNDRDYNGYQNRSQYVAPQWWEQAGRVYRNAPQYQSRDSRQYDPSYPYGAYAPQRNYNEQYPRRYSAGGYPTAQNYGHDPYGYDSNGYSNNYYDNGGSNWKSSLVRMLISTVLNRFTGGNGRNYSPNSYEPNYNSGIPVRYSQNPYSSSYSPQYASYDQGYSYYGQNDPYGGQSNYGGLLGALPIGEILGGQDGLGGILSDGLSQVLAQGYLQGLAAGDNARMNNYGDRYYNDPYVTDNGIYDQSSSTIAENRRLLSEGYALGYQDALNGRGQNNAGSGGGLDLVNVLLSDVFKLG